MTPSVLTSRRHLRSLSAALVFAAGAAVAAPACAQSAAPAASTPVAATEASLERSALRAMTYKVGTFLFNSAAYGAAAGSATSGFLAATTLTVYSAATYVATDYLWDKLSPQTKAGGDAAEVLAESARRTTWKYLTYKAANLPALIVTGYYVTGTVTGTISLSAGVALVKFGLFYANNLAWDYASPAPPSPKAVVIAAPAAR